MKTRLLAGALIFFALMTGFYPVARAASSTVTTIISSEDAYVDNAKPTSNFGGIVTMWIRSNTPTRRALLRFNLSAIPANAQISSAILKLSVSSDGSSVAGTVNAVNGSWAENSVTYATAPQVGGLIATLPNPASPNSSVSVNLTSAVVGKSTVSFYIITSNSDGVVYYTREKSSALAPQLVVTWSTGATSTPTIQPTSTTRTSTPTATRTSTATRTTTPTAILSTTPTKTPTPTIALSSTTTKTSTPTATRTSTATSAPAASNTATATTSTLVPTILLRSATTGTNGSGSTSLALTTPAGTQLGDLLIAHIVINSANDVITGPTGWSLILTTKSGSSVEEATFYKAASGSEPASYTWTFGASQPATGAVSSYAGVDTASPIDARSGKYNSSTATATFTQITTTVANDMLLAFVGVSGNTTVSPPASFSEVYDVKNAASGNGKTAEMSQSRKATAGLTSVGTGKEDTLSVSNLTQLIALKPASGAPAASPTATRTPTPTTAPTLQVTLTSTTTRTPTPTAARTSTPIATATRSATPISSATSTAISGESLTLPLRLAFYYPWFPEAWTQGGVFPFTNYTPTLGFYDSSSASILSQHITDMKYAGVQGGIASWWGQGTPTDGRINLLLTAATGSHFKWTLYYESEGTGNPTAAAITSDLTYIFNNYAQNQSFLRIGGKPVIFVYADATDDCSMVDRWKAANTLGFYVVLKVFAGYGTCVNQPNSWHQYGPAVDFDQQGSYSVTISPGFWLKGNTALLGRDIARWNQDISNMIAANPDFQLITTWNEWGEGTSVESSAEFGRAYLDALHNNGQVTPTPVPSGVPTIMPTSSPTAQAGGSDPTIMAAGDIICDSLATTSSGCQQMAASQVAVDQHPTAALILGDLCHTPSANCFDNYYDPSWGRLFSISFPITGNHEYLVAGAVYYFDYWNGVGNASGLAGDRSQGYYSFDIGAWHVIALNSQCSEAGGCNSGSPQYTWLQQDLQNHTNTCTLAYYHIPVFSSGGRANNNMKQVYTLLYANNVDVVLDGHDHIYERFAPQDPNGLADPARGIREFIVGTGGANHTSIATIQPNSEVRNVDTFGALKLTLHPAGYDWQFEPVAGKTFTDSGTTACH